MERARHCGIQAAGFRVVARAMESFPRPNPRWRGDVGMWRATSSMVANLLT
jgi:hypothetical protein